MKNKKGITLIALVVTVVILIILASISINIILRSGLINRTEGSAKLHRLQEEKERLELIKGEVASDTNHVGKVTVDTYVEELIHKGITVDKDVTDNGDGSKTVITDKGYSVLIEPVGEKDVKITIEGEAGKLPPRIIDVKLIGEGNSIKIEIKAIRAIKYRYYYKIEEGEYGEAVHEGTETSWTIENIEEDKKHTVKVEAINDYGTVTKETDVIEGRPEIEIGITKGITVASNPVDSTSYVQVVVTGTDPNEQNLKYKVYLGTTSELTSEDLIRRSK